ncbi:MAG: hypothetical protein NT163_03150 [Chlorobiales bacterium]|nr:hypothetical protein [Chlorobiales bacterium]
MIKNLAQYKQKKGCDPYGIAGLGVLARLIPVMQAEPFLDFRAYLLVCYLIVLYYKPFAIKLFFILTAPLYAFTQIG